MTKSEKQHWTEGQELPSQDKIRTLGEKETYEYLGVMEAGTIKNAGMEKKLRKNTSGQRENYWKLNYIAEISSKR